VAERVRVTFDTDLRRRRLAVLFRIVLAIPPALVLVVWGLLAAPALIASWVATVLRGRAPDALHRLLRGYLRHLLQFNAWWNLVSGSYPGVRRRDAHPVQLDAPREPQPRLGTLLRLLLAVPALVLGSVLGVVLGLTAVAAWFVALLRGRTTEGLRELGSFCLRYQTEVFAYVLVLTPQPPKLTPPARAQPESLPPPGSDLSSTWRR
jgi:Domain of unknown function (DUF4389)